MRKLHRLFVAMGTLCLLATACVQTGPEPLPEDEVVQIRYWSAALPEVETEILARFQEAHPEIPLSRVEKAWSNGWPFQPGEVELLFLPPGAAGPLVVFTWPDLAGRPPAPRWSWEQMITMAEAAASKGSPDGKDVQGLALDPSAAPLMRALVTQSYLSGGVFPLPDLLYLNLNPGPWPPSHAQALSWKG